MKFYVLVTIMLLINAMSLTAQSGKAKPVFGKTTHDFGKILESAGDASCLFTFRNNGTVPLLLQSVQASCGCTTPEYTKEPVLPGKTGEIKVTYAASGRPGVFNKEVIIHTNVPDSVYKLTIKGEVISSAVQKQYKLN